MNTTLVSNFFIEARVVSYSDGLAPQGYLFCIILSTAKIEGIGTRPDMLKYDLEKSDIIIPYVKQKTTLCRTVRSRRLPYVGPLRRTFLIDNSTGDAIICYV